MPICENCGNDYDKAFRVMLGGEEHVFDCFECCFHFLRQPSRPNARGRWRKSGVWPIRGGPKADHQISSQITQAIKLKAAKVATIPR